MPRKSYPSSKAISGMYFPSSASSGNCIPFQASILGRTFPLDPQPETASHFEPRFWDTLSPRLPTGNRIPFQRQIPGRTFRKPAHPESPSHFGRIRARNHRPIRPPINKEASSRTAGHEVHREFRTQRRPLNVAFVLRRTVRAGNLICLRLDRRFSCGSAASSYLILVVPGARLGSVSLASVWKCSV